MVPAGVRQRPLFRGWPAADGAVLVNLLMSIPLWSRLPVPGVSETGWTLFRSCRPGANNGREMRRGAPGAPFLLVEVGGVGLVHGMEHIDLSAGCV